MFTHLRAADAYRYLAEAARVARSGARIVFTFLEFAVTRHWTFFETALDPVRSEAEPAIVFHSRDAIEAWAAHSPPALTRNAASRFAVNAWRPDPVAYRA